MALSTDTVVLTHRGVDVLQVTEGEWAGHAFFRSEGLSHSGMLFSNPEEACTYLNLDLDHPLKVEAPVDAHF